MKAHHLPKILIAGTPSQSSGVHAKLKEIAQISYIQREATDTAKQAHHIRKVVDEAGPFLAYAVSLETYRWRVSS